ncbi:MAG: hypothetical protein QW620_07335 [Thermoplasmata archaeon]
MLEKKDKNQVEAKKFADVEYRISQKIDHCKLDLLWKEGGLFLTLSEILLSHGEQYYVIPIKEIEHISILSEKPVKIVLEFGNIELVFTGEAGHKLSALRHLLLPYIKSAGQPSDKMKVVLLYWAMGIQSIKALSAALGISVEECDMLVAEAKDRKYISKKGKLTRQAMELFSPAEREKLDILMKSSESKRGADDDE